MKNKKSNQNKTKESLERKVKSKKLQSALRKNLMRRKESAVKQNLFDINKK